MRNGKHESPTTFRFRFPSFDNLGQVVEAVVLFVSSLQPLKLDRDCTFVQRTKIVPMLAQGDLKLFRSPLTGDKSMGGPETRKSHQFSL